MSAASKIKKAIALARTRLSPAYAARYYTAYALAELQNRAADLNVSGSISFTDKRQLVVGKNVRIGKNCYFQSEGGIYLEDNVTIGNNVKIYTAPVNADYVNFTAGDIQQFKTVIIKSGTVVPDNTVIRQVHYGERIAPAIKTITPGMCSAADFGPHMFFIASTGRSGTNAIARLLNKHPDISCVHEPRFALNRLSTEWAHDTKTAAEVMEELESMLLYCAYLGSPKLFFGECDQKYVNLIPFIAQLLPEAKFIWLIRRAENFVASAYGRRWFDEMEYRYPAQTVFSPDVTPDMELFNFYRLEYARYRLNGFKAGVLSQAEWDKAGCFERNCWYWNYWNTFVESELAKLDAPRKLFVRLEDLDKQQDEIFAFLGAAQDKLAMEITNKAYYPVSKQDTWNTEQQQAFEKWCAGKMQQWYNE